jgi:hypothetical protein
MKGWNEDSATFQLSTYNFQLKMIIREMLKNR